MADNPSVEDAQGGGLYPRLAPFEHVHRQAENVASRALHLGPIHHLLRTREVQLYETVRSDLRALSAKLVFLPPLPRSAAPELLFRWAAMQDPPLAPEAVSRLQALGERLLQRPAPDDPVVVPFRFLQLVAWLANNYLIYNLADADESQMIWRYLGGKYPLDTVLSGHELYTLERAGLLRGAAAADPDDPRLVLDPLIAYLHIASSPPAPG